MIMLFLNASASILFPGSVAESMLKLHTYWPMHILP